MSLLSIAPMLDITDRHCRHFHRLFSPNIRLYTEMIHAGAIVHGDRQRFLQFGPAEHPVSLQLGGGDPGMLAEAAQIVEQAGFDEINLNVGCPSDRVQAGKFGACLMLEPSLVAECYAAMQQRVNIPVTIKHRIGVDHQDDEDALNHFVAEVAQAGCETFIVHARKAWLKGLSPKENREIPPLNYDRVYRLKKHFPDLTIEINGGITSIEQASDHLQQVDQVMIGREAYYNSWILCEVDPVLYQDSPRFKTRREIVLAYCDYMEGQMQQGVWLKHMARHLMGLYHGVSGAKRWRTTLGQGCSQGNPSIELITQALSMVDETL